ncbi:WYL domain-containing protein, partial [Pantoea sp. SIMBA_079]
QVMPSRLRHRLDALEVTTVGGPGDAAPTDVSLDVLLAVAYAIRDRETLRFDYVSGSGSGTDDRQPLAPRRVEPHHLVASRGRWYLLAWDLD